MSERIQWATAEDAILALKDRWLYGDVFAVRDGNGRHRRVDPRTVAPHPDSVPNLPQSIFNLEREP